MTRTHAYIIAGCILIFIGTFIFIHGRRQTDTYVRGRYGHYCYEASNASKSIRDFLYFDSEEACLQSIKP